ncbi:MAG: 50S ribosomal protein L15 [Candidatus Latescibacterota bacterium]
MRLGEVRCPPGSRRTRKRRGQGTGSGNGKTAGRGHKGQRARSGARRGSRIGFEGGQMPTYRHLPKIGFSNERNKVAYQVVNVGSITERNLQGAVGPAELRAAGLIRSSAKPVKVLGEGDLTQAVTVRAHAFSRSAVGKIEQAGGRAEVI